jgi:hypothetical protein
LVGQRGILRPEISDFPGRKIPLHPTKQNPLHPTKQKWALVAYPDPHPVGPIHPRVHLTGAAGLVTSAGCGG